MAKYTSDELDRMCDERVMKGIFGCKGCPGNDDCEREMIVILRRNRR